MMTACGKEEPLATSRDSIDDSTITIDLFGKKEKINKIVITEKEINLDDEKLKLEKERFEKQSELKIDGFDVKQEETENSIKRITTLDVSNKENINTLVKGGQLPPIFNTYDELPLNDTVELFRQSGFSFSNYKNETK